MTLRTDLLHLSPEALAQIANVGVVKRAVRELEGGYRPVCEVAGNGTLDARFTDGVQVTWPAATPIDRSKCTCGAASVCRHRVIAALSYRAEQLDAAKNAPSRSGEGGAASEAGKAGEVGDAPPAGGAPTVASHPPVDAGTRAGSAVAAPLLAASPGTATDADLARVLATSVHDLARREADAGVAVEIRRRASGEPCDTARLPTATVRYWAGPALEAARCDCVRATACEHVAIGVWAFRLADASSPDTPTARVRLGTEGARVALDRASFEALVAALLRHGVTKGAGPLAQAITGALAAANATGATWLDHVLRDLEHWAGAYAARSALYEPERGVDLLAELALRLAAGPLPGNGRAVLGVGEAKEVELDKLRLACLGARTVRDGERRYTRLVMADETTGTRLAVLHDWSVPEGRDEARERAAQRIAPGARLDQLAGGQLLAQGARRLADGTLRLAKTRSSMNSVLPQAGDWSSLGVPLRYESVAQLRDVQRAHPHEALLPRHAAGRFVVFTPEKVEDVFFDPNAQLLAIVLHDRDGEPLVVARQHEGHVANALDALAAGAKEGIRHVAGLLRWHGATPIVEPWAIARESVVVPDFATATKALADVRLGTMPLEHDAAVDRVLAACRRIVGELLHHGTAAAPAGWIADAESLVRQLRATGFAVLADEMSAWTRDCAEARASTAPAALAASTLRGLALLQLHREAGWLGDVRESSARP